MKIAYFSFDVHIPAKHAGFVHISELINALRKRGYEVILYSLPRIPELLNPFRWNSSYNNLPIKYVRFTLSFKPYTFLLWWLNMISYIKTLNSLRKEKPDLIYERFRAPNPFSRILAKSLKIPRIVEVNTLFIEEKKCSKTYRKLLELDRINQFKSASAIITPTLTLKEALKKVTRTHTPIYVVPNGVNTKKFKPGINTYGLRTKLGISPQDIVVVYTGSFKRWYGVHQILEFAKALKGVKFLLVGKGKLFNKINKLKSDNIILTGAKEPDKLPKYLEISDIAIAPYDITGYECITKFGFRGGLKVYEYMSAGRPIVAYGYEEIRKVVRDAGLLAPPNNLHQFIENIRTLVNNKDLREKLGEKGRKIAEQEYSWDTRAQETVKIFQTCFKPK
ncbi:glycosyltransferase family 4 protein [candidate division WOR-3 bacterium]|nr:glycosyltransferase family 4 protein [candidate division WOR-3 bacterium]